MAWILRLEDSRILRDPEPAAPPPPTDPPVSTGRRARVSAAVRALPSPAPSAADLVRLLADPEARVRRRAALAVGRVGLAEGVGPLVPVLSDPDPEVRQMAAFALGLIGDRAARDPLVAALGDAAPVVRGSAAEALGLIGDVSAAAPIARMAAAIVESGAVSEPPPAELEASRETPAAAFRLAVNALVRLKAYDALASVVLDGAQPRVRWWPVAFALQRLEDRRAQPALLTLVKDADPYVRSFAARGLGAMHDRAVVPALTPLAADPIPAVAVEAIRALARLGDPSAAPAVMALVRAPKTEPHVRVEAVAALDSLHADGEIGRAHV